MSMSLYYKQIREQLGHELIFIPSVAAVIKMSKGKSYFNILAENTGACQLEQLSLEKLRRSGSS